MLAFKPSTPVASLAPRRLLCLLGHLSPRDNPSAPAQQPRRQQWQQAAQARALQSSSTLGRTMEEPAAAAAAAEKARAKAAMAQAMHPSPSAKHLSQLTNILNARDLAEASPKLKPGRLIRSGSPAHASLEDVLLLRRELHVQQLVDFRSTEEHKEDTAWSLMLSNGVIKTYDTYGAVVEVSVDHNAALHGVELQDIQLHRISLMERSRVVRGMMTKLPFSTLLWAGWYKLTGNRKEMHGVLMPEVNRGGLLLIYQILVDTSQADIAKALQVITTSLEEREPCMFFCKLGKDRTGLIAALVLAACGLSEDEIVADYVRSDGVHEVALGGIEKDSDLAGMDQAVFAAAPPEAMRGLMQYLKERYGGMRQYMEYIGFGREQQAALRRAMTDGDW